MCMKRFFASTALMGSLLLFPAIASGQETDPPTPADMSTEALLERLEKMEQEMLDLKALLQQASKTAETAVEKADKAVQVADAAEDEVKAAKKKINAGPIADTSWHLAGYADTSLVISNSDESPDRFVSGKFNPAFHFQYKDLVIYEAEAEITVGSNGETELELEYTQFDLLLHDNLTLVLGKFLSPVGQFQERLHPSWINKLSTAPAGFGHDGVQPATDVGVQVRGGVPLGNTVFTYAIALGNGPRVNGEGGVELEGFGRDNNNNKSVSGRFGFFPLPYLEVGASFLTSKISGEEGTVAGPVGLEPSTASFDLWGVDAAYTRGPWDVRFEYLNARRDSIATAIPHIDEVGPTGISALSGGGEEGAIAETELALLPGLNLEAWYAQIAFRLSDITDNRVLRNLEPVVRFGEFNVAGLDELMEEVAEQRLDVGLNYWLAPSIVFRGALQLRDYKDEHRDNETRYMLQFAYGF